MRLRLIAYGGARRAEGEAALFEGEALAGEGEALGAVEELEEGGGFPHLRDWAGERRPGKHSGLVEGRGVEVGGGEGGEGGGDFGFFLVVRGEEVAAPVEGEGALADGQAEFGAEEIDDLEVRAVFVFEPDAEALAAGGAELLEFGVAAGFSGRARRLHAPNLAEARWSVSPLAGVRVIRSQRLEVRSRSGTQRAPRVQSEGTEPSTVVRRRPCSPASHFALGRGTAFRQRTGA